MSVFGGKGDIAQTFENVASDPKRTFRLAFPKFAGGRVRNQAEPGVLNDFQRCGQHELQSRSARKTPCGSGDRFHEPWKATKAPP
jgi:hypothetical protein